MSKPKYTSKGLYRYIGPDSRNIKNGDFLLKRPMRTQDKFQSYNTWNGFRWSANRYNAQGGQVERIQIKDTPSVFWPDVRPNGYLIVDDIRLYEVTHVLPLAEASEWTAKRVLTYRLGTGSFLWGTVQERWQRLPDRREFYGNVFELPEKWQYRVFEASLEL